MIREVLAVGCGGAVGSIARYLLGGVLLGGSSIAGFPVGTFAVNAIGSLLIGVLLQWLDSATATWLLVVGFCGGFTTFSTFSADAVRLMRGGEWSVALLYVALSVGVCVAFAAVGIYLGDLLRTK